jgi:hypothetical protein
VAKEKTPEQTAGAQQTQPSPKKKKMTGWAFWFMLALALIKDLLDLLNFTILLSLLTSAISIFITLSILFYLFMSGVSFVGKNSNRKLAVMAGQFIIEVIPFVNLIPATALSLIILRLIENGELAQKIAGKTNVSK